MKLYTLKLKEPQYDCIRGVMVASDSIPNALEEFYRYYCYKDGELVRDIPFALRSSNMNIECIGEFIPNKKLESNILFVDFYDA